MSDPRDAQLNDALAQLPRYYTESYVGEGVVGLLHQAASRMRLAGRSEAEIAPMFQQAVKELASGLDAAAFNRLGLD